MNKSLNFFMKLKFEERVDILWYVSSVIPQLDSKLIFARQCKLARTN